MSDNPSIEILNQNIKASLTNFKKINDLLLFDNNNIDLNETLKVVIKKVLDEIIVVNVLQPGYYSETSIEQFQNYYANVENPESNTLNYDIIKVLSVAMENTVYNTVNNTITNTLTSNEANIINEIKTILGDNFKKFNEFYLEIKMLSVQLNKDENIDTYYTKLNIILKELYQKGYLSYCYNSKKLIIKFKLYRFSMKLANSPYIKICLDIQNKNIKNLYEQVKVILNKIFTFVKLIKNFNSY